MKLMLTFLVAYNAFVYSLFVVSAQNLPSSSEEMSVTSGQPEIIPSSSGSPQVPDFARVIQHLLQTEMIYNTFQNVLHPQSTTQVKTNAPTVFSDTPDFRHSAIPINKINQISRKIDIVNQLNAIPKFSRIQSDVLKKSLQNAMSTLITRNNKIAANENTVKTKMKKPAKTGVKVKRLSKIKTAPNEPINLMPPGTDDIAEMNDSKKKMSSTKTNLEVRTTENPIMLIPAQKIVAPEYATIDALTSEQALNVPASVNSGKLESAVCDEMSSTRVDPLGRAPLDTTIVYKAAGDSIQIDPGKKDSIQVITTTTNSEPVSSVTVSQAPINSIPINTDAVNLAPTNQISVNPVAVIGVSENATPVNLQQLNAPPVNISATLLNQTAFKPETANSIPMIQLPVRHSPINSIPINTDAVNQAPTNLIPDNPVAVVGSRVPDNATPVNLQQLNSTPVNVSAMPLNQTALTPETGNSIPMIQLPVRHEPMNSIPINTDAVNLAPTNLIPVNPVAVIGVPDNATPVNLQQLNSPPINVLAMLLNQTSLKPVTANSIQIIQLPVNETAMNLTPDNTLPANVTPINHVQIQHDPIDIISRRPTTKNLAQTNIRPGVLDAGNKPVNITTKRLPVPLGTTTIVRKAETLAPTKTTASHNPFVRGHPKNRARFGFRRGRPAEVRPKPKYPEPIRPVVAFPTSIRHTTFRPPSPLLSPASRHVKSVKQAPENHLPIRSVEVHSTPTDKKSFDPAPGHGVVERRKQAHQNLASPLNHLKRTTKALESRVHVHPKTINSAKTHNIRDNTALKHPKPAHQRSAHKTVHSTAIHTVPKHKKAVRTASKHRKPAHKKPGHHKPKHPKRPGLAHSPLLQATSTDQKPKKLTKDAAKRHITVNSAPKHKIQVHRGSKHQKSDHRKPDHRKPNHRKPDHRKPKHRKPKHRKPNHHSLDHIKIKHRKPKHKKHDHRIKPVPKHGMLLHSIHIHSNPVDAVSEHILHKQENSDCLNGTDSASVKLSVHSATSKKYKNTQLNSLLTGDLQGKLNSLNEASQANSVQSATEGEPIAVQASSYASFFSSSPSDNEATTFPKISAPILLSPIISLKSRKMVHVPNRNIVKDGNVEAVIIHTNKGHGHIVQRNNNNRGSNLDYNQVKKQNPKTTLDTVAKVANVVAALSSNVGTNSVSQTTNNNSNSDVADNHVTAGSTVSQEIFAVGNTSGRVAQAAGSNKVEQRLNNNKGKDVYTDQ